jgi:hypothetical protein
MYYASLMVPALFALSGCGGSEQPQRTTQVIVQPQPAQQTALISPSPPPPAQVEQVLPPPAGAGPVVWQPGHWQLSGSNWVWQPGHYAPPPAGETTWVPGYWAQQPDGRWVWVNGHWA